MYSARIDGKPTTFGTSGLLYRSNKLMYDRETNTLWSSFLGVPVIGPIASSDFKLKVFPAALTTWDEWLAEHPDSSVLSPLTDFYPPATYVSEEYERSAYYRYRASADTMFPVWSRDGRLETKTEILGVSVGDGHKAYPVSSLRALRVINDSVADRDVVIISSAVSSDARVYERNGQEFNQPRSTNAFDGRPSILVDDEGRTWTADEAALVPEDGSIKLRRLPSNIHFWFAWFAFHPETEVYDSP